MSPPLQKRRKAWLISAALLIISGQGFPQHSSVDATAHARQADRIVIIKSQHLMTLMVDGRELKSYKVALGRVSGAKERQGDHKTPEGQYIIDQKNSASRFHLALHISYPNAFDRKRAHEAGIDPGGLIMIHGLEDKFAWLGALQSKTDWTDGCIAVTNQEIEEIWKLVPVGTPVEIKP